jgi:hypothetical protein
LKPLLVVNELDRDSASSVAILQEIFNDPSEWRVLKMSWPTFMQHLWKFQFPFAVYNSLKRPQISFQKQ